MISEKELKDYWEISEKLFVFGEQCVMLLRREDTRQREFEALSIDLASRFAYLAEFISLLADEIGSADYLGRYEASPQLVSEAARKYLNPLF